MSWPVAIASGWHPVAFARDVGRKPFAAKLMGRRLVLVRDAEGVFALEDRCPHRGLPLSHGRSSMGAVSCPYHGWSFGRGGRCLSVPGTEWPGAPAIAIVTVESAGLVWACLATKPPPFPVLPAIMLDDGVDRFWWRLGRSRAGLLDAVENHLDPAHPHQIHPWMVRSPTKRRVVEVRVRSGPWGAEAVYVERSRPAALMPRLLEGRRTVSIGRLHAPTIAEVVFEGDRGLKLSILVVFTPEDDGLVRPWAHFATPRGIAPAWLKAAILKGFHIPVLHQDRHILALQEEWRGNGRYAIGPLDLIGPTLWRMANGEPEPERDASMTMML